MHAVSVRGLSKKYRIFPSERARLKETLSFGRKSYGRDFWALKDINLDVEPGTTLGIIGRNGAGKSTLLSIISGILRPTAGEVEVNGRLVALFALGAGFNPEFTGRENIMLNGLILGIDHKEMALQKVYELRDSGTTILFVSHSLPTVEDFCNRAVLLHEGHLMATGETTEVIAEYQALVSSLQ